MIKKHNFTELINMEGISDSVLDETIREIIRRIEYSPEKYLTLLEENKELKRMIGDNTQDYMISLKREIKKLKEDNMKIIKKYNKLKDKEGKTTNTSENKNVNMKGLMLDCEDKYENEGVAEEELENYNTLSAAIKSRNIMRDRTDGKYHINGGIYEKIRGTREEVWCGTAYQTTGELKRMDLEMNKYSKIVSKVKMITATIDNNFIKYRGTKFPLWPLLFGQGVRGDSMSPVKSITIKIEYKQRIIKDEYFLLFYYLLNRMIEWFISISL